MAASHSNPRPSRWNLPFHPRSLAPRELEEAGCFDYSVAFRLFLGRTGYGPLRIAWDTNILIDWRDFGVALLSDESVPRWVNRSHQVDLEALGEVMTGIWRLRDIRICPLSRQLRDLGRGMGQSLRRERLRERARQLDEFASAFWCLGFKDELRRGRVSHWRATFMRPSADRRLVEEAMRAGCHVFLTRDKRVLRHAAKIEALGAACCDHPSFFKRLRILGKWLRLQVQTA